MLFLSENKILKTKEIAIKYELNCLYLYGSFLYGKPHKYSDVDFIYAFNDPVKNNNEIFVKPIRKELFNVYERIIDLCYIELWQKTHTDRKQLDDYLRIL